MVALTYGDARLGNADSAATTETAAPIAPRKAWYARMFDAMVEARMQQARREIGMYARLAPYMFDQNGNLKHKSETESPAGGW